jgi:threonine/homoserine/homoserine lactone efflux protein
VLRVVGAIVLLYLGAKAWRAALRDRGSDVVAVEGTTVRGRRHWWTSLGEGFLVQLANPKAAVFTS